MAVAPRVVITERPKPATAHHAALPPRSTPIEPTRTPSLGAELQALRDARTALAANDGRTAAARIAAYLTDYPQGTLREEAMALRVRALRLAGDTSGAARARMDLRLQYPDSVYSAP